MNEAQASQTALGTCLMRAIHTRLDHPALIDDSWGERLLLGAEREALRSLIMSTLDPELRRRFDGLNSPDAALAAALRQSPAYASVILRTRYTEDALEAAVARGIHQYVILGAGMDSFALRQPAFARGVEVIEVDHPATQDLKRERLRLCCAQVPPTLHFVAVDLRNEDLGAALARSPYRRQESAFFSWLGVTMYLTREANLATLRAISACSVPGSELVFTYVDQREFDPDRQSVEIQRIRSSVASVGEPWVSGFDPGQLAADLRGVGLSLVEDLDGEQLSHRYYEDRKDALRPAVTSHCARAHVTA